MEDRKHAIQEDQFEKEQRKEERVEEEQRNQEEQCKEGLCFEEERCEEVEREKEVHRAQVQPKGFEIGRAGNESDEAREAEVRAQRQEGHESEAGHRDRIVRGPEKGSKSTPWEEIVKEVVEIVSWS
ncbi:MAG: hypothetical protein JO300_04600 [Silvibacterium sp.]|nr:hypothetical protein [Silvibacterium sp.]MBV8436396.1 hypothetical protein [Silvibacterium sp.]